MSQFHWDWGPPWADLGRTPPIIPRQPDHRLPDGPSHLCAYFFVALPTAPTTGQEFEERGGGGDDYRENCGAGAYGSTDSPYFIPVSPLLFIGWRWRRGGGCGLG